MTIGTSLFTYNIIITKKQNTVKKEKFPKEDHQGF